MRYSLFSSQKKEEPHARQSPPLFCHDRGTLANDAPDPSCLRICKRQCALQGRRCRDDAVDLLPESSNNLFLVQVSFRRAVLRTR